MPKKIQKSGIKDCKMAVVIRNCEHVEVMNTFKFKVQMS